MAPNDRLLPVGRVAELLGVSASTVWRWTRTPGCTRWRLSDVEAFAAGGMSPLEMEAA